MPKVKVFMLGRFEIVANGTEVIKSLGSSKKRIVLLEYLILNRDKPILMKDLFEVLWPGENSTNPESALKTLVSRLRATLSDYSPDLSDCIITERGGYRWNPALDCEIDVFSFEAACNDVLRAASLTPEVRAQAATLMTLYAGELLPNSDMDAWVVARSVFLHNMYLKAVQHYIVLLKGEDAHDEIAQVCRLALDVDAFDATLNLELMTALLKIGRSSEALAQYNHATDLHYNQLGIQPPEGMLEFYKKLIKIDNASKTDIDSIRAELCADDTRSGAFVCEYVIFKDIYQRLRLNIFEYSFKEHDETIAYSLSVPFTSTLVFASIMKHQEAPGTTFKKHMDIARGLLSEDDYLLTEILFNPNTPDQVRGIQKQLSSLLDIIERKDSIKMKEYLTQVRKNIE